jgi:hypothetical protein
LYPEHIIEKCWRQSNLKTEIFGVRVDLRALDNRADVPKFIAGLLQKGEGLLPIF